MHLALAIALCIVIAQVILAAVVMRAGNALDPKGKQPARKYRFTKARA